MAGLARLAASDTAVALENMPILVELGDIGMSNQMTAAQKTVQCLFDAVLHQIF